MVSTYTVIQYVPNPIADERINIGVVAFNDKIVKVQFIRNWERVRHFGMEEIDFLKSFAHQMEIEAKQGLLLPADKFVGMSNTEKIFKISKSWINSIQFTEPCPSLDNVNELLEDIATTYLRELNESVSDDLTEIYTQEIRSNRQNVAAIVKSKTRAVLRQKLGEAASELLKIDYEIPGKYTTNKFDVVVANGKPYFAAHSISFLVDVLDSDRLTDAILWRVADVKSYQPDLPLGILILPPNAEQHNYEQLEEVCDKTVNTCKKLGADIVYENELETWVSNQIENTFIYSLVCENEVETVTSNQISIGFRSDR